MYSFVEKHVEKLILFFTLVLLVFLLGFYFKESKACKNKGGVYKHNICFNPKMVIED